MGTDVDKHASTGVLSIRVPPEPPIDAVIVVRKTFGWPGKAWIYVGYHADNGWFLTCRAKKYKACSWLDVVKLSCFQETTQPDILLATDFEIL